MAQETTKRKSKDSVFVDLFTDKNYVFQLYQELHPEDTHVTIDDSDVQTIKSVLVNTLYNDLGFLVKDRFVILVEAQSIWNPNITIRILFYLAETYRRYLHDTVQSEHSGTKVHLPKPDLYVVYSGDEDVPDVVSLNEDFFCGDAPVDIKVRVLKKTDETICGQYIKVFNEQRKLHDNKLTCAQETIRICIEQGYLATYLKAHEKEAVTMMAELFDEEYLRGQYNKSRDKEMLAEGETKGILNTLADLVKKGLLTLTQAAEQANMSVSEFETKAGLR
ncbi:MAG: hypothetical protein K2G25_03485 [Oscillospiraceae bacterium]|nr:hypothetical protein [Oscillospiraceae bacterium]